MDKNIIGVRLRELRGGKTLKEVADSVKISLSSLAMYESGRRVPKDDVKLRLANYYGKSVEALFFAQDVHTTCTRLWD